MTDHWIRGGRASGTVHCICVNALKVVGNGVNRAACGFNDNDVARFLVFLGFHVGEAAEFGDVFHAKVTGLEPLEMMPSSSDQSTVPLLNKRQLTV